MKKIFIYLIFLIFSFQFYAQELDQPTVEYGAVFKNDKREIPVDIVGKDENGYYLLYSEGRFGQGDDIYLRKFNLDLTPSGEELNLKTNDHDGEFNSLGLQKIKNKIYHLFYVLNNNGKSYYYQTVDLSGFKIGSQTFITEVSNDTKKASNSISRFLISEDEETISMFYTIPNKKRELTEFKIKTFDSDFKEISTADYEFPFQNDVLSLQSIFSNSKNELFIISKKFDSYQIEKEDNYYGYEYLIYKIQPNDLKLLSTIRPNDVHLRALEPTLISDDELSLTGLYSKNDKYAMIGLFATKINLESGNVSYSKYNKFSAEYYAKLFKPGKRKDKAIAKYNQGKREDPYYILKQTYNLDNNELLVLAEQARVYSHNYSVTFYNENIAAIKLNDLGEIIWKTKIGKLQEKRNVPIYNSYYPTLRKGKMFLFYNCNTVNLDHEYGEIRNSFNHVNHAFIATVIDENGNFKRNVLSTKDKLDDIIIRPRLYNWIDDNTLLMFGQDLDNLKNQRFIKIKF